MEPEAPAVPKTNARRIQISGNKHHKAELVRLRARAGYLEDILIAHGLPIDEDMESDYPEVKEEEAEKPREESHGIFGTGH